MSTPKGAQGGRGGGALLLLLFAAAIVWKPNLTPLWLTLLVPAVGVVARPRR